MDEKKTRMEENITQTLLKHPSILHEGPRIRDDTATVSAPTATILALQPTVSFFLAFLHEVRTGINPTPQKLLSKLVKEEVK